MAAKSRSTASQSVWNVVAKGQKVGMYRGFARVCISPASQQVQDVQLKDSGGARAASWNRGGGCRGPGPGQGTGDALALPACDVV